MVLMVLGTREVVEDDDDAEVPISRPAARRRISGVRRKDLNTPRSANVSRSKLFSPRKLRDIAEPEVPSDRELVSYRMKRRFN